MIRVSLPRCVVFLVTCALVFSACRSTQPYEPQAPDDFTVEFGHGGGFTGHWEGHVVAADGAVQAWQGLGTARTYAPVGSMSMVARDSLWHALEGAPFFGRDLQATGNMTRYVKVMADGKTHEIRWPETPAAAEAYPNLTAFFAQALRLAEGAKPPEK